MLAKADITQLMNQLRVELIGASDAQLRARMFDTMTEFFNDSSSWTEIIDLTVVPDTNEYDIAPTEGQIIRLAGVIDSQSCGIAALMPTIGTLLLRSAPNTAQTYQVKVVNNVSLPTTKDDYPIAPEWVLKQWHTAIKEGMLGNMMNEKNKSYSDPKGALYHLSRFRKGITDARIATLKANTNGAQAWRFPQSFRANTQQGGVPSFGGSDRTF
jgi:hypothetical protein